MRLPQLAVQQSTFFQPTYLGSSIRSNPGNPNHEKFRFSGTSSNSPDYFNVYSDVIYSPMEWHHVMAVFENGTQKFYYDGSLASSDNWNYSIVNTSTNLIVGKKEGGSFLNGSIDDVQIWNVPLTQQEIQQLDKNRNAYMNPNLQSVNQPGQYIQQGKS